MPTTRFRKKKSTSPSLAIFNMAEFYVINKPSLIQRETLANLFN